MSRFLKNCTIVQIFEQRLHATIANLIGPHRFVSCQLIASASTRKEEKIAVIIFGNF